MSHEPTTVEKLRGLPWSIAGNSLNTVFVQFTYFGSVFVLFLSELGLTKSQMGILLSFFPFSGLVALFIAPWVARFGYKRTFLTFYGTRKFVTALLLLTPWVLSRFDLQVTLIYVAAVVAIFALCRAIAETGYYPWIQEYVPNSVRGKYAAASNAFTTLTGFAAVTVAGFVVGRSTGIDRFMFLIAVGVLSGLLAVWAYSSVPGGRPVVTGGNEKRTGRALKEAVRDKNFWGYLAGVAFITLGSVPMVSFLPLFMQEQVGLSPGSVVWLQTGSLLGGLMTGYLWGWAADRYGSKPVLYYGLFIKLFLPLAWLLMPRFSIWSLPVALSIALFQGLGDMGWGIGSGRLLYVTVVPEAKKSDYMALYYTWIGIVGGVSQLAGGRVLDLSQGIEGRLGVLFIDPYTPLFVAGLVLTAVSILLFKRVRADSQVSVGAFTGLFLRGNPFLAMGSLIRYQLARDEHATVLVTERLGESKSLLTVDELLDALADPRFNVRFEAIVSIARIGPDERLIKALVKILAGPEPALSVIAAWALGRMGDDRALEPLREGLDSHYRSIQAHSSRSLGALGDQVVIPLLLERLAQESDYGLRVAYASALGQLSVESATGQLLDLLASSQDQASQMELALALARIVGDEHHFIQLLRQTRGETGTSLSQAISALRKKVDKNLADCDELLAVMGQCAETLATEDLTGGLALLPRLIQHWMNGQMSETSRHILQECLRQLDESGDKRLEYVLLSLHVMYVNQRP